MSNTASNKSETNSIFLGKGENPVISGDGRYVVFEAEDVGISIYDRESGKTKVIGYENDNSSYEQLISLSDDARYIIFASSTITVEEPEENHIDDRINIFNYDTIEETTQLITVDRIDLDFTSTSNSTISPNGRFVVFIREFSYDPYGGGDSTFNSGIFLRDLEKKTTKPIVLDHGENSRYPYTLERIASVSNEGDIAFKNSGTGISIYDFQTDKIEVAIDAGDDPEISADGKYILYSSASSNLVENDNNFKKDIFIYDRTTKNNERISIGQQGLDADDDSFYPSMSEDGRYVVFVSEAENLVSASAANEEYFFREDIFIYDRQNKQTQLVSSESTRDRPSISGDGKYITYSQYNVDNSVASKEDIYLVKTEDALGINTGNSPIKINSSLFDLDGNGQVTFSRDILLLSAYMFYQKADRTDYSVLDRFILDSTAVRKTGNDIITDFNIAEDAIQIDRNLGFTNTEKILASIDYSDSTATLILGKESVVSIAIEQSLTVDNFVVI